MMNIFPLKQLLLIFEKQLTRNEFQKSFKYRNTL